VLAHAHTKGFGTGDEYLQAADHGYRFLVEHFFDPVHGGFVWATDRTGRAVEDEKVLYGQAFAIYCFVEYARAGRGDEPIQRALELYRVVDEKLHDRVHGGWDEYVAADWGPLDPGERRFGVDVIGRKSGDSHLHWMEALTELYGATGDADVRSSLEEVVDVTERHLFPPDPSRVQQYCFADWSPDPHHVDYSSYGHSVEEAWLRILAERALGIEPAWERLWRYVDHVLDHGFDHRRGGVYSSPSMRDDKVWWVQAEMVAALTDALVHRYDARHVAALAQVLGFVERHQVDRTDGVWLYVVTARGHRRRPVKADVWKVGYHEVRAGVKLVDAFATVRSPRSRAV
jgi:mannobiose 2-epimerase